MRRVLAVVLVVGICVGIMSCSDDDGPGQFRYPMKVGSSWYYTRSWYSGPTEDSLHLELEEPVKVTIGAVETLGSVGESIRMDIEGGEGAFVYGGAQYYQNREDGLRLVGYCDPGGVIATPKSVPMVNPNPDLVRAMSCLDLFSPVTCDGPTQIEAEPLMVLPYPLRIGNEWQYRDLDEFPLTIRKLIKGWSNVEVPAGKFDAYRIDWIYTTGQKVEIHDDIASIGLLRRQARIQNVAITSPAHPVDTVLVEYDDFLVLDSVKLK